ncbi:MAG: DUF2079 domain-containing protein [Anaerolineales bacterium]|nr:DUF2079 domain-containing protein [Anaerolineales bacterium]MCX7607721.1 DUF2079 domain-containing protein [Anaerolineales bacterium]MDW8227969.1 hypothetical protein [Anaerolineales bacterium]
MGLSRRQTIVLGMLALASALAYLLISAWYYRVGFPLDDAWIHQTYARNLAWRGEWAFMPGQPSGGSTSPLWTMLLTLGYLFRVPFRAWTYLLGVLLLFGTAWLGERLLRQTLPAYRPKFPWFGAFLAMEWHLAWAAVSGMEILLFIVLTLLIFCALFSERKRFLSVGLLTGLLVWVRPDGLTLLGPALWAILFSTKSWKERTGALFLLSFGFALPFAFYLLFNLRLSGAMWPNTFYAKQAEYAVYLQISLLTRLGQQFLQPLVGAGLFLLPGVAWALFRVLSQRRWLEAAIPLWIIGFLTLYALRLPVTYQHGRYAMPVLPFFALLGWVGWWSLRSRMKQLAWRWRTMAVLTFGALTLAFWGRGAVAYAQDVAVIESEMVQIAHWAATHLPAGAVVAAHDIGALGYFTSFHLLDLAGLVSPEVIPFLRDEAALADFLDRRGAQYLITFPDWYPTLTSSLQPIYVTNSPYAPMFGERNMAVYRWNGR